MTCRDGGGKGGSWANRVLDGNPDGDGSGGSGGSGGKGPQAALPGGGSKPEVDRIFSSGNNTDGGMEEMDEGDVEDTAESSTSRATGERSFNALGDDDMEPRRPINVDGGNDLKSCGVADSVFTTDTSAAGGRVLSVSGKHRVDRRVAIVAGQPGICGSTSTEPGGKGLGPVCEQVP